MRHCKLWKGKHTPDGYGVVRQGLKQYLIHRIVWSGINGPIPENKLILHKCDTPACFNPNHLFLGTYSDNNRDRMHKGRSALGERSGRHKLTEHQVKDIRHKFHLGNIPQSRIAPEYGVSGHTISMIVNNRIWRHI